MSKNIFNLIGKSVIFLICVALCIIRTYNIQADTNQKNIFYDLNFNKANINELAADTKNLNEIIIYGSKSCAFCIYSINLAKYHDIVVHFIELDDILYDKLTHQTSQKTIPYIFVNKQFIGGYQNLLFILNKK